MSYKTLKKLLIWERKQKKMGCSLPTATMLAEVEEVEIVPSVLLPCPTCSRTFRPEALAKHVKVCEKTLMKKRKKFDSSKQRIQGTELAQFLRSSKTGNSKPSAKPPSPKREAIKRVDQAPPARPRPVKNEPQKPSDHEQCPYCERFFGPKAYERHIEWCKEQQHRRQVQSDDVVKAKERLQARTKYQAPSLKGNKTTTKEKYSSMSRQSSNKSSASQGREEQREKSPPSGVIRQAVNKSHFKHRSPTISDNSRQRTSSISSCEQKSQCSSEMENSDGSPRPGRQRAKPKMTNSAAASRLNRRSPTEGGGDDGSRDSVTSKFCHECGGRYPVPSAKFCCVCGVQRIAI